MMTKMQKPNRCNWIGQPKCHFYELKGGNTCYGHKVEPFELCDDKVAMKKMHCTCQPSTMGFGSKEEYLKAVINDKNKLNYYVHNQQSEVRNNEKN